MIMGTLITAARQVQIRAKSDCVAQTVAQNSHLFFNQPLEIADHEPEIKAQADSPVSAPYQLSRSLSSQRAPPQA
jgi:hypothetical protein